MDSYLVIILGLYRSGHYISPCVDCKMLVFTAAFISYQTANGVVSGIQWVPAEATNVLPAGAQPANSVCCPTLCPVISDKEVNQSIRNSCHLGVDGEMKRQ